jgi:hypothetical protein
MSGTPTPGPWLFRGKDSSIRETSPTHPYGGLLAQFAEDDNGAARISEADLDLVLAAPDLLAACEAAARELNEIRARDGVPWTHQGFKASVTAEHFSAVVDACFAAIAKAKGTPNGNV